MTDTPPKRLSEPKAIAIFAGQAIAWIVALLALMALFQACYAPARDWHLTNWRLWVMILFNWFIIKLWVASYRNWRKEHP